MYTFALYKYILLSTEMQEYYTRSAHTDDGNKENSS